MKPEAPSFGQATTAGEGSSGCRFCGEPLVRSFVDLGTSPLCESFIPADELERMEPFFPLHPRICDRCGLVQLPVFVAPADIFEEYAYLSSYSTSWVEHARRYVEGIVPRLGLGDGSFVVELASNDGYLLQHFLGTPIRILGIDPARNVAAAAEERGVPTLVEFFGLELAERVVGEHGRADLVIGNNVLAQVPDLNDFVAGVERLLAPSGTATFEFPDLLRLVEGLQYDTIYHEHFSYFSLDTARTIVQAHGLDVYDVEELPTHGGSLRIYLAHRGTFEPTTAVVELLEREASSRHGGQSRFARFAEDVAESKRALLELLLRLKRDGRRIVGYGAPGKGNTLLNYCGIRTDFLDYTVDRNPYKQGRYLPGTRIPIFEPEKIAETKPDYVLVLPWNIVDEISRQLEYIAEWGGQLIVPIPVAQVVAPGSSGPPAPRRRGTGRRVATGRWSRRPRAKPGQG
jgi:SAM-dependent methyltransferase